MTLRFHAPTSHALAAVAAILTLALVGAPLAQAAVTPGTPQTASTAAEHPEAQAQVELAWSQVPSTPVKGTIKLHFTGRYFQNVEVFQGRTMVSRATVKPGGRRAVALLDTTKFADGALTLTAHAWDSLPGQDFTSEADAGPITLQVANGGGGGLDDHHPDGYTLVFKDEFDGSSLNRNKWCTRYVYGGGPPLQVPDTACQPRSGLGTLDFLNDEQQRYVDYNTRGETMHVVSGGVLTLRTTKTRSDPNSNWAFYESAMIRSKQEFRPSASTTYYLTARVWLPNVIGTWPAFWLSSGAGTNGVIGWPPEIDIFEGALNGVEDDEFMLHQAAIIKGAQTSSGGREYTYSDARFDRTWNNYRAAQSQRGRWVEVGLHWSKQSLCYFVDGLKTACENYRWRYNDGTVANPAHLLLNLAVGGAWAGRHGIDDARFPTSMQIDHVRVYRN